MVRKLGRSGLLGSAENLQDLTDSSLRKEHAKRELAKSAPLPAYYDIVDSFVLTMPVECNEAKHKTYGQFCNHVDTMYSINVALSTFLQAKIVDRYIDASALVSEREGPLSSALKEQGVTASSVGSLVKAIDKHLTANGFPERGQAASASVRQ